MTLTGKCSHFGGPQDTGVAPDEGLALLSSADLTLPHFAPLFLPAPPPHTTGLARRLNPEALYCAMRWDYAKTPRVFLRAITVTVRANGKSVAVQPVDWGPNIRTGRIIDLSPGALAALGAQTDDVVTVEVPEPEGT